MDPFNLHIFQTFSQWQQAISDPRSILKMSFHPDPNQIEAALNFLLAMVLAYAILAAPLALRHRGDLGEKLVGLFSTAILVMAWHFPFVWLGGKASFAGSFLAYCYGAGPYLPLTAFAMVIFAAGLPSGALRHFADPAKLQKITELTMKHPDTSKGIMALGGLGFAVLSVLGVIVTFRSLSFVHSLTGWRFFAAILLSTISAYPIHKIFLRIGKLSAPSHALTLPPPAGAQPDPAHALTTLSPFEQLAGAAAPILLSAKPGSGALGPTLEGEAVPPAV